MDTPVDHVIAGAGLGLRAAAGLVLLALGFYCFWSGWSGFFVAVRKFRIVLRRRKLANAIVAHFRSGAQFLDVEVLALRLCGENHETGLIGVPKGPRQQKVKQLTHEITLVAEAMPKILAPFSESFDFAGDGAAGSEATTEACVVPGLYMLTNQGQALIGGGS